MVLALRECSALPNYDFAITAEIFVNAEADIDLAISRHLVPLIAVASPLRVLPTSFEASLGSVHKTKDGQQQETLS
jgi:hypothetical protein